MNDIEKWYEKLNYEEAKELLQEKHTNLVEFLKNLQKGDEK